MSNIPFDSGNLELLLRFAAQKQGTTVEALQQKAAENPDVQQLLHDPQKLKALLERPEIAELLSRLKGQP